MTPELRLRRTAGLTGLAVGLAALLSLSPANAQAPAAAPAQTPAPSPANLAEGMRLYQQKADCRACHGWAADGNKSDNQMPDGPSLREKKFTRNLLVLTIKCGRPGTGMPAFDKFAYSDGRCFMMQQADLDKLPMRMPDPAATLQQREIELIADFLMAKVVGQGPLDHAKCVDFWGSEVEACRNLAK